MREKVWSHPDIWEGIYKPKDYGKCKVEWCEWDAEKSGSCAHHNANPDADQEPSEWLLPELAEHLGIERQVIREWIRKRLVQSRPYKSSHAVKLEPWMLEFSKTLEDYEPYMAQEPFA